MCKGAAGAFVCNFTFPIVRQAQADHLEHASTIDKPNVVQGTCTACGILRHFSGNVRQTCQHPPTMAGSMEPLQLQTVSMARGLSWLLRPCPGHGNRSSASIDEGHSHGPGLLHHVRMHASTKGVACPHQPCTARTSSCSVLRTSKKRSCPAAASGATGVRAAQGAAARQLQRAPHGPAAAAGRRCPPPTGWPAGPTAPAARAGLDRHRYYYASG